jgi:sugar phosphate isomerase/epimerase
MIGSCKMNRRSFIGAGIAGVALATGVSRSLAAPAPGFRLGVCSYSFLKFSRAEAIKMIQQLGEKYVNIKSFHLALDATPGQIRQARKEFEDAGLTIVGCGTVAFNKPDEADIRSKFEYAKLGGMPVIVCAPLRSRCRCSKNT